MSFFNGRNNSMIISWYNKAKRAAGGLQYMKVLLNSEPIGVLVKLLTCPFPYKSIQILIYLLTAMELLSNQM